MASAPLADSLRPDPMTAAELSSAWFPDFKLSASPFSDTGPWHFEGDAACDLLASPVDSGGHRWFSGAYAFPDAVASDSAPGGAQPGVGSFSEEASAALPSPGQLASLHDAEPAPTAGAASALRPPGAPQASVGQRDPQPAPAEGRALVARLAALVEGGAGQVTPSGDIARQVAPPAPAAGGAPLAAAAAPPAGPWEAAQAAPAGAAAAAPLKLVLAPCPVGCQCPACRLLEMPWLGGGEPGGGEGAGAEEGQQTCGQVDVRGAQGQAGGETEPLAMGLWGQESAPQGAGMALGGVEAARAAEPPAGLPLRAEDLWLQGDVWLAQDGAQALEEGCITEGGVGGVGLRTDLVPGGGRQEDEAAAGTAPTGAPVSPVGVGLQSAASALLPRNSDSAGGAPRVIQEAPAAAAPSAAGGAPPVGPASAAAHLPSLGAACGALGPALRKRSAPEPLAPPNAAPGGSHLAGRPGDMSARLAAVLRGLKGRAGGRGEEAHWREGSRQPVAPGAGGPSASGRGARGQGPPTAAAGIVEDVGAPGRAMAEEGSGELGDWWRQSSGSSQRTSPGSGPVPLYGSWGAHPAAEVGASAGEVSGSLGRQSSSSWSAYSGWTPGAEQGGAWPVVPGESQGDAGALAPPHAFAVSSCTPSPQPPQAVFDGPFSPSPPPSPAAAMQLALAPRRRTPPPPLRLRGQQLALPAAPSEAAAAALGGAWRPSVPVLPAGLEAAARAQWRAMLAGEGGARGALAKKLKGGGGAAASACVAEGLPSGRRPLPPATESSNGGDPASALPPSLDWAAILADPAAAAASASAAADALGMPLAELLQRLADGSLASAGAGARGLEEAAAAANAAAAAARGGEGRAGEGSAARARMSAKGLPSLPGRRGRKASTGPSLQEVTDRLEALAAAMAERDEMGNVRGSAVQRVAAHFVDALAARQDGTGAQLYNMRLSVSAQEIAASMQRCFSALPYVDFCHLAAFNVLLKAAEGCKRLHIVVFGFWMSHHWVKLLQALASLPGGPPSLRVTGVDVSLANELTESKASAAFAGRLLMQAASAAGVPLRFQAVVLPGGAGVSAAAAAWGAALAGGARVGSEGPSSSSEGGGAGTGGSASSSTSSSSEAAGSTPGVQAGAAASVSAGRQSRFRFSPSSVAEELVVEEGEALAVLCNMSLTFLPDDSVLRSNPRDLFLRWLRLLSPAVTVLVEIDAPLNCNFFLPRFRAALDFFGPVFESLADALPEEDEHRLTCERLYFCRDIVNVVACEGLQRTVRSESLQQWQARMGRAGFTPLPFDRRVTEDLQGALGASRTGGFAIEQHGEALKLVRRGKPIMAATAWRS